MLDKSVLTEISQLPCVVGGMITVKSSGQQSEASKQQVAQADTDEMETVNPLMDYTAFQDSLYSEEEDDSPLVH